MNQRVDWAFCQGNSDQILAEGIFALRTQPAMRHSQVASAHQGNYLILLNGEPYYIGEAKELAARLRQQFKPSTSTFYKTFIGSGKYGTAPLDKFQVQFHETNIGRKEIEEFGIVNIPTKLNKFQLGKRAEVVPARGCTLWLDVQARCVELLVEGEQVIFAQTQVPWFAASVPRLAGIYVVRDSRDEIIYIGESSDIGERYATHSGTTYFSALRRHIGTDILGLTLKTIKGRTRYFSEEEDGRVTDFLRVCRIAFQAVSFGRYELEEISIRKYHPLLNRKENKSSSQ
ncbi:MAG: GIY-YIG nuclease family protein [Candidatus Zixiibacteriota bacterium]|nr:MAG: GIY-YIG nuclease family protein [candidate division Zixibacteria bacterium]